MTSLLIAFIFELNSTIFSAKIQILIWTLFSSQEAVEYTKSFVTSVVLGKDVVPRIGLHQLESLRHDLIYAIHKSTDPKVKYRVAQQILDFWAKFTFYALSLF